jgi:spoIIIJ-associated protein
MNQETQQANQPHHDVQSLIEYILQRMNIQASVERADILETPCYRIHSPDNNLLIGENGQHLFALSTIVKRMAEQAFKGHSTPFLLDINDFQRQRIEAIKERARMGAQRVRYFKKEVRLQPMNGYDRRIVHVTLAGDPDVATESIGEGENRRIIIKPVQEPPQNS